jgi:hypothetical protein
MQWEEKLFWISRGFRVVLCIEIVCLEHGTFRAELEAELDEYACPLCACRCRATIICEGVTRRVQLSANWELLDRPLWPNIKRILLATPDELVKPRKKKPKRPLLSKGRQRLLGLRALGK